jgi:hypothetical protein
MRNEEKCNQLEKKDDDRKRVKERETSFPKRKYHPRIISNKKSIHMTVRRTKKNRISELQMMMITE